MKFELTLDGLTPLLLHADDIEASDEMKRWQMDPDNKDVSVKGDDRSPPWTWQTRLYSDGRYVAVPCDNLSASLLQAGSQMILKGNKTYKELSQTGIFIVENHLPILVNGKPVEKAPIDEIRELKFSEQAAAVRGMGFSLFVKRARVGAAKHVRVRPRFDVWQLRGTIEILAKELDEKSVRQMFDIAGFYKGICDWRGGSPRRPGRFGQFKPTLTRVA